MSDPYYHTCSTADGSSSDTDITTTATTPGAEPKSNHPYGTHNSNPKKQPQVTIDGGPSTSSIHLRTPYRAVSMLRSGLNLLYIIIGNCICTGAIVFCLWRFSIQDDLVPVERRIFNVAMLLLSAGLGFGIGFLCDRIGLLGQGAVLQSRAHPPTHVGYIIKGTLSAYASIFIRRPNNLIILVYLVCAVCGRFGVAFLGFGYNLEQSTTHIPPLSRPDWVNLTISGPIKNVNITQPDINSFVPISLTNNTLPYMSDFAQHVKGPTLIIDPSVPASEQIAAILEAARLDNSKSMANIDMEIVGTSVIYRYKFQDFSGLAPNASPWEAVIESSCWRYDTQGWPDDRLVDGEIHPYTLLNFTEPERYGEKVSVPPLQSTYNSTGVNVRPIGNFRWIMKIFQQAFDFETGEVLWDRGAPRGRGQKQELWLMGASAESDAFTTITGDDSETVPELAELEKEYIQDTPLLFNCSFSIAEVPVPHLVPASTDFQVNNGTETKILGETLYNFLRTSFTYPYGNAPSDAEGDYELPNNITIFEMEQYKDSDQRIDFHWGVSRKNQTDSEIWLAAYVGKFIVNQLSFLNDLLGTVEIEPSDAVTKTQLNVYWTKIALILGILLGFQILFAGLALWYCKGKFELLDDVSTISSVLEGFSANPPEEAETLHCRGWFVQEGDGVRWVLDKGKRD